VKYFIIVLLFFTLSRADVITFAADEYCPYNCTPESEKPGYLIEIAQLIFQQHNHEVKYILANSFDESIQKTRSGEYDAILSVLKIDVSDFIFPLHPQIIVDNVFFVRKEFNWQYNGVESLKKIRLGHIVGYSYFKELDEYIATKHSDSARVQDVSGPSAFLYNLKKLRYRQIDAIIEDRYVIDYYYQERHEVNPFKVAERLFSNELYIAFSPKGKHSKEYAKILSDGMIRLQKDGTLETILEKYGLKFQP